MEFLCARFFGEVRDQIDSSLSSDVQRKIFVDNQLSMIYSSLAIFNTLLTRDDINEIVSLQKQSAQPQLNETEIYADFRNLSFSSN